MSDITDGLGINRPGTTKDQHQRALERNAQEIAGRIASALPEGTGFFLSVFGFDASPAGQFLTYVSNANREDAARSFRELLARWEPSRERSALRSLLEDLRATITPDTDHAVATGLYLRAAAALAPATDPVPHALYVALDGLHHRLLGNRLEERVLEEIGIAINRALAALPEQ